MATPESSMFVQFGNLPDLPLNEIRKHLKPAEIMLSSIESTAWRNLVRNSKTLGEAHLDILAASYDMRLIVSFPNAKSECFVLKYISTDDEEDEEDEEVQMECKKTELGWEFRGCEFVAFSLKANQKSVEKHYLEMLGFILKVFRPKLGKICVRQKWFTENFVNKVLNYIPPGKAQSLEVPHYSGDQQSLQSKKITYLLENVKFEKDIILKNPMSDAVKSSKLILNVTDRLCINDCQFLTRENLLSMRFSKGEFGVNNFTSEDFNLFLRQWKKADGSSNLKHALFSIRQDQQIKLEDILKGLEGKPYNHSVRDKSCEVRGDWMNFENGVDIFNSNQLLLTVFLDDLCLILVTWPELRPLERAKRWVRSDIEDYKQKLASHEVDRARLDAQLLRNPKSRNIWKRFDAKMKQIEECERALKPHLEKLKEIEKFE